MREERQFQLTRLAAGDYLCPSNDEQWLWRFRQYDEDGSASRSDGNGGWVPLVGKFWAAERTKMPTGGVIDREEINELLWQTWAHHLRTRKEAIEQMLNQGEQI